MNSSIDEGWQEGEFGVLGKVVVGWVEGGTGDTGSDLP